MMSGSRTSLEARVAAHAMQPYAEKALAAVGALDTLWWPVRLEFLLPAMVVIAPAKAWRYAAIATLGAVGAALVMYLFGWLLGLVVGGMGIPRSLVFWANRYDVIVVLATALTPLPLAVVALAGGVLQVSLPQVVVAALVARGARIFTMAWLVWRSGPSMAAGMRQWFDAFSLVVGLGLLLVLCLIKFMATYGG